MYKAQHGADPELDVSLYGDCLEQNKDLKSQLFLGEAEQTRRKKLLMQIMTNGDGVNPGFVSGGVLEDPTAYEV
jgi:hypothetical protein